MHCADLVLANILANILVHKFRAVINSSNFKIREEWVTL